VPTTWDEMLKLCKALTTEEHSGFQTAQVAWAFYCLLWMNGGSEVLEHEDKTITTHFTAPEVLETAKFYRDLAYVHKVWRGNLQADIAETLQVFQGGKSAMYNFMPSWFNWMFGKATFKPEQLNFLSWPVGPSGAAGKSMLAPWVNVGTHSWLVASKRPAAERDAAARYICWMNSKKNIIKEAEWWRENGLQGVYASPFKDVPWDTVSSGVPKWWGPQLKTILGYGRRSPAPAAHQTVRAYREKAIQDILLSADSDIEGIMRSTEARFKAEFLDDYHAKLKSKSG